MKTGSSACGCGKGLQVERRGKAHGSLLRQAGRAFGFLLSSLMLVLMPKCPVCLAAYAALLTGVSLSVSVAGQVRVALLGLCISLLVYLTLTWISRWWRCRT